MEIFAASGIIAILSFTIATTVFIYTIWPHPLPSSGKITSKRHEEKSVRIQNVPSHTGRSLLFLPVLYTDEESWIITIEDDNGLLGDVHIAENTWKKLAIGDYYETKADDFVTSNENQ